MSTDTTRSGATAPNDPNPDRVVIAPDQAEWTHPLVLHATGDGEVGAAVLVAGEDATAWSLLDRRMVAEARDWLITWLATEAGPGPETSHAARAERYARPLLALYSGMVDPHGADGELIAITDLVTDLLHLAGDQAAAVIDTAQADHRSDQTEDGSRR